jgi:hypothetical protein
MDEQPSQGPMAFASSIPLNSQRIRAAAVYCSDGRFGLQFDEFLQTHLGLPRYDRLALPGGPACLAAHFSTFREEEAAVEELRFLVKVHQLKTVVLIAHHNCAFYTQRLQTPELQLETQQREDLQKAISRVRAISSALVIQTFFARVHDDITVRFEVVS